MSADGPLLTQEEAQQETRDTLWLLRNLAPPRPAGPADPAYIPPARWLLPPLRKALARLTEAAALALEEVPTQTQYQAKMLNLRSGPEAWYLLAGSVPEVRRLLLVKEIVTCVGDVISDLENEGRPQPVPDLRLTRLKITP